MIIKGLVGILLIWCTYMDVRTKKLSKIVLLVFSFLSIFSLIFIKENRLEIIWGLIPGIILIISAWITKEAIGWGDGILVCILGIFLGKQTILLVIMALILAGVIGSIFIIFKKENRKYKLPFVPFLLGAYGLLILQYII